MNDRLFPLINSGELIISNNLSLDADQFGWDTETINGRCNSFVSLPLKVFENVWGNFVLFAGEKDFFDKDEIKLLDELAMDLGFAIEFIEHEKERTTAEEAIIKYQNRLRSLVAELTKTEEMERSKIAIALHDQVGQSLGIAKLRISEIHKTNKPEEKAAKLQELEDHINTAIQETRGLTYDLSPPMLRHVGLVETVKWRLEQMKEIHHIQNEVSEEGTATQIGFDLQIMLYRTINELIMNVIKYAKASLITVHFTHKENAIEVLFKDNGVGFDSTHLDEMIIKGNKWGIFSIRERILSLNGKMEINSRPGEGTDVHIIIPV